MRFFKIKDTSELVALKAGKVCSMILFYFVLLAISHNIISLMLVGMFLGPAIVMNEPTNPVICKVSWYFLPDVRLKHAADGPSFEAHTCYLVKCHSFVFRLDRHTPEEHRGVLLLAALTYWMFEQLFALQPADPVMHKFMAGHRRWEAADSGRNRLSPVCGLLLHDD